MGKAKAIMVVGTTSGSGKSIIATAICRYLKNTGYSVAPYKALNMSLNSRATHDGHEIGTAQFIQAEAAGVLATTDMNPILIKPQKDMVSQVILNGKIYKTLFLNDSNSTDFYKKQAFDAYDRLSSIYDFIVMEGAGSPAELNILDKDIANMEAALYADAKTILVGDIDRGGVFASVYGTVKLLPEKYKRLIKGIIINKFRGQKENFAGGVSIIEELVSLPVFGVMPFIHKLFIDDEDSLSLDSRIIENLSNDKIKVTVVKLPHISNYTDFIPFERNKFVELYYANTPSDLDRSNLVIIPGSKCTLSDMKYLHDSGFAEKIIQLSTNQIPIIGICGGYQMLGKTIKDPLNIEGNVKEISGMGLLNLTTEITENKTTCQVEGILNKHFPFKIKYRNIPFTGYEIHCGVSRNSTANKPIKITKRNSVLFEERGGSVSKDNYVFGCYIHGLFESEEVLNSILKFLAKKFNKNFISSQEYETKIDKYDRLAKILADNIDLSLLLK